MRILKVLFGVVLTVSSGCSNAGLGLDDSQVQFEARAELADNGERLEVKVYAVNGSSRPTLTPEWFCYVDFSLYQDEASTVAAFHHMAWLAQIPAGCALVKRPPLHVAANGRVTVASSTILVRSILADSLPAATYRVVVRSVMPGHPLIFAGNVPLK